MLCKNTNTERYFSTIKNISSKFLDELSCSESLYFHPDYLYSLEKNNPQITFTYIILTNENERAIALAILQIIDFPLAKIESSLNQNFHNLKCFGRKLGMFPKLKPIKLLVCGNIFVSGEHGVFIKKDQNKQLVFKMLAKAITQIVNKNKALSKDISVYLVKDFVKDSLPDLNVLHGANYASFTVEPNMVLTINESWTCFQDYLDSLKTKFRIKAKRALKLSSDLVVKDSSAENIKAIIPEITQLYQKVVENATFNLGNFNVATYISLKKKLGDNYIVKTYWADHKLVGFMSGMITNNSLDAHFVGIDYSLNKELAIYQRMLYDYVAIAINKNLKTINFGRTASEIKSSVGAVPQDLTCYIRHKKSLTNTFLKPFLNYIEPKPFKQKYPFKTTT
ncbi:MAG: N-acetyltransferase [Flavobacteriaceae bacterium]|nr:N-acetyltransferase [Flavobacteriaceae bacterium]